MTHTRHRSLLLTFDAFSTIFHPRRPVPELYSSVAHSFGLPKSAVAPAKLQEAFKIAYKRESKAHPNYGRDKVLRREYGGPRQWWSSVITATFTEVLGKQNIELPHGMIEKLLDTFASQEGYTLYDDVNPYFDRMRDFKKRQPYFDSVVTGIISNSDDRITAVLKSLGFSVGNTRADADRSSTQLPGFEESVDNENAGNDAPLKDDFNMVITSYEAGEEKPNRLIFDVAARQAERFLVGTNLISKYDTDNVAWTRIHVGDDLAKDYEGAINAGWHGVFLNRDTTFSGNAKDVTIIQSLEALFPEIDKFSRL